MNRTGEKLKKKMLKTGLDYLQLTSQLYRFIIFFPKTDLKENKFYLLILSNKPTAQSEIPYIIVGYLKKMGFLVVQ